MRCNNCGNEMPEGASFCTACGTQGVTYNATLGWIDSIFRSKLFFALTILMTVSAAAGVASGGLPVITILAAIALWMGYSATRSGGGPEYLNSLKFLKGIAKAQVILEWIAAISIIVSAVLLLISGSIIGEVINLMPKLEEIPEFTEIIEIFGMFEFSLTMIIFMVGVVLGVIGIALVLINVFAYRNISRFASSVCDSAAFGTGPIEKLSTAKSCMLVLGILCAVSAVSEISANFIGFISTGALAAAQIVVYVILDKADKNVSGTQV